jgi:cyclin H
MSDEMVFGDVIQTIPKRERKPMSPRVSLGADRSIDLDRSKGSDLSNKLNLESESSSPQNRGEPTGMGVKDEAMGLLTGGSGLKEVGLLTEES